MEREGFGYPATDAVGETTAQPERDFLPDHPGLSGGAPKEAKKGITGRVKGLVGRRHRRKHRDDPNHPRGVAGKIEDKTLHPIGHGGDGDKHGPARLLSMSSSTSSMSSSDEENIGTVGFALDPTGPPVAGQNLGRRDFTSAPAGPGADFSPLNLSANANKSAAEREHEKRAKEYAKWSVSANPNDTANKDTRGEPAPAPASASNRAHAEHAENNGALDTGRAASDGGAAHAEEITQKGAHGEPGISHQGQIATHGGEDHPTDISNQEQTASDGGAAHPGGPRDANVKQEGFMSKIMDTFRSPKEEPAPAAASSLD